MTAAIICGTVVFVAIAVSHAFHSWLALRRLSDSTEARFDERFRALEKQLNEQKNHIANLPRR
jgi:hypothetical protein